MKTTLAFTFSILVLLFSTSAASAKGKNALSDKRINNSTYGFTYLEPDSWYATVEMADLVDNIQRLDPKKEKIDRILKQNRGSSLAATYYKYDRNAYADVIPTVNILIRQNPFNKSDQFERMINQSIKQMATYFNDFKVTSLNEKTSLNGKEAYTFTSEFTLNAEHLGEVRIKNTTYSIPMDGYFIQLSMSERYPLESDDLFRQFAESMTFPK